MAVLFLVGDAGDATVERAPLVHRLRRDVEEWSGALGRDSAVAVLFLGDNVYPDGLRPRSHPGFPRDSARLHAQIWTVDGPHARRHHTPGLFLAGNHDWGNMAGEEGAERARHMARYLDGVAREGPSVSLEPDVGGLGPEVVDVGDEVRLVVLDTHWWLQAEEEADRSASLEAVAGVLEDSDGRTVILAAHHPWVSGGPHAGQRGFDLFWLLRKAGAFVQDLNSGPYRRLRESLEGVFRRTGPPLVYAAGHDHSLQVLESTGPTDPGWTLVSGAGSKLTSVSRVPGMRWAASRPGYMRLVFRRGGGVELFVVAGPEDALACEGSGSALARCMERSVEAFETDFSLRLR